MTGPDAAAMILPHLPWIVGGVVGLGATVVWGWIHTTKLRIQHGYPLEGAWGQTLQPTSDGETKSRVTLLTQENAELRAEMGAMKDRLANVERIVTDEGFGLASEIDSLRDKRLEHRADEGNA